MNNYHSMKTYHTFRDAQTFEKYLHTKHQNCEVAGKYGGCLDYVWVGGILYTMHEYDDVGHYITWANKYHQSMIEMTTADRYKNGYADAKVEIYPATYLRNDINYAD